jgi:hypothetical protein
MKFEFDLAARGHLERYRRGWASVEAEIRRTIGWPL